MATAELTLPLLQPTRCREHLAEDMRVVTEFCAHVASRGRIGRALVCERCGYAGHQWNAYACRRARSKQSEIDAEHAACPIRERMLEQKRQQVPG